MEKLEAVRRFLMASETLFKVAEVGIFRPWLEKTEILSSGEIGYIVTGLKEPVKVRVGDTITKFKKSSPSYSSANLKIKMIK